MNDSIAEFVEEFGPLCLNPLCAHHSMEKRDITLAVKKLVAKARVFEAARAVVVFCPEGTTLRETCGQVAKFNVGGKMVEHKRSICSAHVLLREAERALEELDGGKEAE